MHSTNLSRRLGAMKIIMCTDENVMNTVTQRWGKLNPCYAYIHTMHTDEAHVKIKYDVKMATKCKFESHEH
jgi:hypothetical protein